MNKTILFLIITIFLAQIVSAGTTADAEGGNITQVDIINAGTETTNWQGFSGQVLFGTNSSSPSVLNATGAEVNQSNLFFEIDCDNPTAASGFVFISNASSQPTSLTAGNITQLDEFVSSNTVDNASQTFLEASTFTLTQGTIIDVPTVYSFINQTTQNGSFRQGYFNQGNSIVFATVIEEDLHGYNSTTFDYQALLPAPSLSTVSYFIFGDISFTCPEEEAPPTVGGGGGGRRGITVRKDCINKWSCSAWGGCDDVGLQQRACEQITECPPPMPPSPPTTRVCPLIPREEEPTIISEDELLDYAVLEKINLLFEDATGPIFVPTKVQGALKNNNDYSLEDMSANIIAPKVIVTSDSAHPHNTLLWGLSGWDDHGEPGVKTQSWTVKDLSIPEHIDPRELVLINFEVIPPMMQPKTVDLSVDLFSGPIRLKSANVPFTVTIPAFAIAGEIKSDVLTVYYVVDNRGQEEKDINIELALDRERTTLVGELIGPLTLPADKVSFYGYEYKLGKAGLTADTIRARLIMPERTRKASYSLR